MFLRHCVKSVLIRIYFWSVFSCILTEYRDLWSIQSKYKKIRTRNNCLFGHFSRSEGDYVSANLFIFYLTKALDSSKHDDHDYRSTIVKPRAHISNDHQYVYINDEISLKMEYAVDMSHTSSDMRNIEYAKKATIKIEFMGSHYEWGKNKNSPLREMEKWRGRNVSSWERC